jgi:competence protein ComEC
MQASVVIICLGYIIGLLLTSVPWGGVVILLLGIVAAIFIPRSYRNLAQTARKKEDGITKGKTVAIESIIPRSRIWLVAGLVGLLATIYFQFRQPQPGENDISRFVVAGNKSNQEQLVIVTGEVISTPHLTRSQKGQFWLQVTQLDEIKHDQVSANTAQGVAGKLYVTAPILQVTGLYPGQKVTVSGVLYLPKAATNPGSFDFQKYLRQQGAYAGLAGKKIGFIDGTRQWGWWELRERIIHSLVGGLGVPEGALVSAMVLGKKAVDLPYDIQDLLVKAGLTHILTAFGFKTSLILGLILQLTKQTGKVTQILLGSLGLVLFLGIVGFSPAVLRAVFMGFAALVGLALNRKGKRIGMLLLAATLILLINPLWIWDLGFQMSFLATLGLIVTASPMIQRLDWLPPVIASLITLPLAATIWTLPLLLTNFPTIASYSILLNILSAPFVSLITIGGLIVALISPIIPELASTLASCLYYPTHWLIQLTDFFAHLPGNSVAVGSISTWQALSIYALLILTWLLRWWQRRWWFSGLIIVGLLVIPIWHSANTLVKITVLATNTEPVIVIQDKGVVTLINSGDENTGRYTVIPFLQQQGINQIDWAVSTKFPNTRSESWLEILQNLPIKNFYEYPSDTANNLETQAIQEELHKSQGNYQILTLGQAVNLGSSIVQLVDDQFPILQAKIFDQNWLLTGNITAPDITGLVKNGDLSPSPQVLWCPTESIKDLLQVLQPQVAIAPDILSTDTLEKTMISKLSEAKIKLLFTGRDGAVQWTPNGEFETFIQTTESSFSAL